MNFETHGIPKPIVNLWVLADDLWEEQQSRRSFESYASANYFEVYHALESLKGQANSFLELGSGLGIVTMMASHLGFESYGIEAKEMLVEYSRRFAEQFEIDASFSTGSFIPDEFEWNPADGDESVRTFVDETSAYDGLGMELDDFDLIYAYPWPTEHSLYVNFLKKFARPGAIYLSFDAREGTRITRL